MRTPVMDVAESGWRGRDATGRCKRGSSCALSGKRPGGEPAGNPPGRAPSGCLVLLHAIHARSLIAALALATAGYSAPGRTTTAALSQEESSGGAGPSQERESPSSSRVEGRRTALKVLEHEMQGVAARHRSRSRQRMGIRITAFPASAQARSTQSDRPGPAVVAAGLARPEMGRQPVLTRVSGALTLCDRPSAAPIFG